MAICATFLRHFISLNDFGGVENILDGDVHSGGQFSFPMNLALCCSEQTYLPESIDVITNIMPPTVFWNVVVLVVVVSRCGQGFIMMVILPW